jgi:hypothetical protein
MRLAPFKLKKIPPSHLKLSQLKQASASAALALAKYNAVLENASPSLLTSLKTREAVSSLESLHKRTSLRNYLKDPSLFPPITDYLLAIDKGMHSGQGFTLEWFRRIHRMIKRSQGTHPDRGVFRKRQNWIGPEGCTLEQAYYLPPDHKELAQGMKDLIAYCKKTESDPLIQLAIAFAQFLIIHPFMDGNGRVARLMIPFFLYQKKMICSPHFFMSSYFKKHRLTYFQLLFGITESGKWEPWILFFLKGIKESLKNLEKQ